MLHAVLHGKLDESIPEPERLEDALTSTVFGTLVWMDQWELLSRWLLGSSIMTDGPFACECWFWPRLAGGVQPDVVLRLHDALVLVEAKYRSGRHDLTVPDEADESLGDQLYRQYQGIVTPLDRRASYVEPLERAIRECRLTQVFVVDSRRRRQAQRECDESCKLVPRLRLVTWQELFRSLSMPGFSRSRWSEDLRTYLELVELDAFQGIRQPRADATQMRLILRWHPQLRPVGLRNAVRPAIGLSPLARAWRAPDRRETLFIGRGLDQRLVDGTVRQTVLEWRSGSRPRREREGRR